MKPEDYFDGRMWGDEFGVGDSGAARAIQERRRRDVLEKIIATTSSPAYSWTGDPVPVGQGQQVSATTNGLTLPDAKPTLSVSRALRARELRAVIAEMTSAEIPDGSDEWEDGFQTALALVADRLAALERGEEPDREPK